MYIVVFLSLYILSGYCPRVAIFIFVNCWHFPSGPSELFQALAVLKAWISDICTMLMPECFLSVYTVCGKDGKDAMDLSRRWLMGWWHEVLRYYCFHFRVNIKCEWWLCQMHTDTLKPKHFMILVTHEPVKSAVSLCIFMVCRAGNATWPYSPLDFPELIPTRSILWDIETEFTAFQWLIFCLSLCKLFQ